MKRIKCFSALLTLAFLFCVGNVHAQQKATSVKKQVNQVQMSKSKTVPNSTAPAETKRNSRVSELQTKRVVSPQTIKTAPATNAKKAISATSTNQVTRTNNVNNLNLVPVYGAKANPVNLVQLQARGQGSNGQNHKNTRVSKTTQKSALQSAKKID